MPSGADYLFSTEGALSQPATRLFLWLVGAALVGAPLAMLALRRRMSEATRADAWIRYRTWLVIAPAFLAPLLLMPFTAILAVAVVSILCYREFARATGFLRGRLAEGVEMKRTPDLRFVYEAEITEDAPPSIPPASVTRPPST